MESKPSQQTDSGIALAATRYLISGFVMVLALVVMVGWSANVPVLVQLRSHLVPMQFNTALCFFMLGLALFLLDIKPKISVALAAVVVILVLATLLQYLFYINLGIDQLLMQHHITVKTSHPGRMPLNSALCFLAMALALICYQFKQQSTTFLSFTFAAVVGVLGIIAIVGYLMKLPTIYSWGNFTAMAVHTAIGFILLSAGLMIASGQLFRGEIKGYAFLIPAAVFVAGSVAFLMIWQVAKMQSYKQVSRYFRYRGQAMKSGILREMSWRKTTFMHFFSKVDQNPRIMLSRWRQLAAAYLAEVQNSSVIAYLGTRGEGGAKTRFQLASRELAASQATDLVKACQAHYKKMASSKAVEGFAITLSQRQSYYCQYSRHGKSLVVSNISALLTDVLRDNVSANSLVTITNHGQVLYSVNISPQDKAFMQVWQTKINIVFADNHWLLTVSPSEQYMQDHSSWLIDTFFLIGLLALAVITLIVRLMQLSAAKNFMLKDEVKKSADKLQKGEALFSESMKLYESVFDMVTDGWWDLDLKNGKEYLSAKLKRVLGYSEEEIENSLESWQKLIFKNDLRALLDNFNEHLKSKGQLPFHQEVRFHHKQGHVVWILCRGQGIVDTDGVIRRVIGTHTDITELKETEYTLQQKLLALKLIQRGTQVVAESEDFISTLSRMINVICEQFAWPIGHAYILSADESVLMPSDIWHIDDKKRVEEFYQVTMAMNFEKSVGLPGRVWESMVPALIEDINTDDNFPRAKLCKHLDLYGAIACPIISSGRVVAVLEFFSYEKQMYSEDVMQIFCILSDQVSHAFDRKEATEKLTKMARFDVTTELANRVHFHEVLTQILSEHKETGKYFSLIYIDIDNFKMLNDSLGHTIGDNILHAVARRLAGYVGKKDFIARLGGDEFIILLREIYQHSDLVKFLTHFQAALAEPFSVASQEVTVSTSIGVVTYPEGGEDAVTLLKNADMAMYRAKEIGRGNYEFYNEDINQRLVRSSQIAQELNKAISDDQLYLVFQPEIDLITGRIFAAEALLRWSSEQLGEISPTEFIPVAENIGLMQEIGNKVFEKACQQIQAWREMNFGDDLTVSINCSVHQLHSHEFLNRAKDHMRRYQIKPSQVILEITETKLVEYFDDAVDVLRSIDQLGIKIAVDDFGTGYSTLNYLRNLPISVLKIDKSFIADIGVDSNDEKIIHAIIELSKALSIEVVAEGIETKEQLQFLMAKGCHFGQGYYFAKPLLPDHLVSFVKSFGE